MRFSQVRRRGPRLCVGIGRTVRLGFYDHDVGSGRTVRGGDGDGDRRRGARLEFDLVAPGVGVGVRRDDLHRTRRVLRLGVDGHLNRSCGGGSAVGGHLRIELRRQHQAAERQRRQRRLGRHLCGRLGQRLDPGRSRSLAQPMSVARLDAVPVAGGGLGAVVCVDGVGAGRVVLDDGEVAERVRVAVASKDLVAGDGGVAGIVPGQSHEIVAERVHHRPRRPRRHRTALSGGGRRHGEGGDKSHDHRAPRHRSEPSRHGGATRLHE